jgi:hypothetical protein
MALFALPWLAMNFVKLLWEQGPWGAVDLKLRYNEVQLWFAGRPVYRDQLEAMHAVYPPASYIMLWPLLGWLTFPPARVVWAAMMGAALGGLGWLFVKESRAQTRLERIFVVLILLSMYATGFSIGHGQLTIFVLWGLVTGLTLMSRDQQAWQEHLVVTVLILVALVKPTLSVPFLWLMLFLPGTLQPALFVVLGYTALTMLAIAFQGFDLYALLQDWLLRGLTGAASGAVTGGYGNVHSWLAFIRLEQWNLPVSLLVVLALGFWTYQYRHGDLWLLLGVTAIVARFWTYHRSYDDMLILLPMITLFRIARDGHSGSRFAGMAGLLLAIAVISMFVPALIFVLPSWKPLLKTSQTPVPLLLLIFLLYWGRYEQRARTDDCVYRGACKRKSKTKRFPPAR